MTPWLDDGDVQLYHGDVIATLRELPAGIAQTCVTSPPYWNLRDYGTGEWTGGDPACDHKVGRFTTPVSTKQASNGGSGDKAARDECPRCGARRVDSQLGLEATPDLYVERLVTVFREVWRVLRDDGTVWLNLGDSYNSASQSNGHRLKDGTKTIPRDGGSRYSERGGDEWPGHRALINGLKPKDLVGVPWKVAFALQTDGWYLRSDIIWAKNNPMPESVTDRPTKAHEYLFLLSKRPRYYFDADAIREESEYGENRATFRGGGTYTHDQAQMNGRRVDGDGEVRERPTTAGRNRRSVWTIPTEPFPEAHFATYPQALVRPCILAGSRPSDTIIDPFIGSGTTALVARNHGRRCIGIDLSAEYLQIAARRLQQLSLLGDMA